MDFHLLGINISKNICKNLSNKYSQTLIDHAKQSATDANKASSKKTIQTKGESTGNLIANKIE